MANTIVKLTKEQLEQKKEFINQYIKSNNAADGSSVDANANVSSKNIATLSGEIHKDINTQIKRYMVSQKIESMFGKELAEEYNRQIENHEIYVHDESHFCKPYCVSLSLYPFLVQGLKGLGGESKAPKHLDSFCGNFINLVYATASQFAGAVATVEFLMYFDYFARKDFGGTYLVDKAKHIEQKLQQIVYTLNQPASSRDYQSVFWNISLFDKPYFESIFGDFVFPDCTKPKWETLEKLQEFFMTWFNKEREVALLTFPVITSAMLSDGEGNLVDDTFLDMCAEQDSKGNSFFKYISDSADSLASCCRLRNPLQENTFSYSLGAGGVATGSLNVITINANRCIQIWAKEGKDYKVSLKEQVEKIHKYQIATKEYLTEYLEANMMPVYSEGFINMKKQFLTVGLNGLVEAAEFLGYIPNNNEAYNGFVGEFLKVIYDTNNEGKSEYKQLFNTEFVPAENLGVKHYNWDKKDDFVVNPNRNCYNSYMYAVEDESIDVVDKFLIHGKDNLAFLDGGSALHLNLEEYPTKEAYKKLYQLAAKTGCNYWTTNIKVTCCEDCGHIDKNTLTSCNKCNSNNITYATRIIGYLKKVSSFSSPRQQEEDMRFYHKSN